MKERVDRAGGVGGLRDREREKRERMGMWEGGSGGGGGGGGGAWGWDEGGKGKGGGRGDGDGDGEGEGEDGSRFYREDYTDYVDEREEGFRGSKAYASSGGGADDDGDEEGGYTMDMMLKSLNVELAVIGFDMTLQKWVD